MAKKVVKKKVQTRGNVSSMHVQVQRARINNDMLDHAKKLVEKEKVRKKPGDAELRMMGYGTCLDRPSFINIDNAMRSAKLKTDYPKTLRLMTQYFKEDVVIGRYIADKYIADYVRTELANKYTWNDTERLLVALVKDITGITQPKQKATFNFTKEKSYMLMWEDVTFSKGSYTIRSPKDGSLSFVHLTIHDKVSTPSLNYIREYLQDKMPRVYGTVQMGKLELTEVPDLSIAVRMLQSPTYSNIVEKKVAMMTMTREVFRDGIAMSFADSMSKARQLSPEDFKKYKSKFINFLISRQIDKYRVIPCNEEITHLNSSITENAFIFSLKSNKWTGSVILVVENLNADRATLLFRIDEVRYESCLSTIHAFLKSTEINKRSNLRMRSELIQSLHAYNFHAVDHRDDGPYTWKSTMEYRLRSM